MIVVGDVFVAAHLFDAFAAFAFDSNSVFELLMLFMCLSQIFFRGWHFLC